METEMKWASADPSWVDGINDLRHKIAEAGSEVIGEYIHSQNNVLAEERARLSGLNLPEVDAPELTRVINTIQSAIIYAAVMNIAKAVSFFDLSEEERQAAKKALKIDLPGVVDECFDDVVKQYDKHLGSRIPDLFKEIVETAKRELASRAAKEGRY